VFISAILLPELQEAMRAWYVVSHWLQVVSVLAGT
jgi:hypothetical protein